MSSSRADPSSPRAAIDAWISVATLQGKSEYYNSHRMRYAALVALLDSLALSRTSTVLEVGSGDGLFASFIQDRSGWRVQGLDCVETDVLACRARGIQADLCDVDRDAFPAPSAEFDLVLFDSVLEHLYEPRRAIGEISRVLKPGGLLVLGTPNATSLVQRLRGLAGINPFERFNRFNAIEGRVFMRECAVFYTPREVEAVLGDAFRVRTVHWTHLVDPYRQRRSWARNAITPIRIQVCRTVEPLSDFFYLVAEKR